MSRESAEKLKVLVKPFECEMKPMFGHEVYWVNGNMFAGVFQRSIWLRLSQKDQSEFLEKYKDARQFEPMEGRPMKDYVVVPESLLKDKGAANEWIGRSYRYTASLPEKRAKARNK